MPYDSIRIDGSKAYKEAVTACLDKIATIADGKKLLGEIARARKEVTIRNTENGNACGVIPEDACPPLTLAFKTDDHRMFSTQLKAAVERAISRGLTLEHFARQLSIGMTRATYKAKHNVGRAPVAPPHLPNATPEERKEDIAATIVILKQLMAGNERDGFSVERLPENWDYQLPRLLREHLTPAVGGASTVYFNPTKPFYCRSDRSMHLRPAAIGLCHEMIHALHSSKGTSLILVESDDGANLEELVTTGIPPYHYEELSDNKMRTQWPDKQLEIRVKYMT